MWQMRPYVVLIASPMVALLMFIEAASICSDVCARAPLCFRCSIYSQGLRYFDAGYAAALALVFIAAMSVLSGVFMAVRRRIAQD